MIQNLYEYVGRVVHRLASPLLWLYPKSKLRVRVLVLNEKSEIMLTRSWFGYQRWSLPGGGIRRGEEPTAAAIREVFEETGVAIDIRRLTPLGQFENGDSIAPFTVDCYVAKIMGTADVVLRQRFEILGAMWVPLDDLPENRSSTVDRALALSSK